MTNSDKPSAWMMKVHGVTNLTHDEGTALGWINADAFPVLPLYTRSTSSAERGLREALERVDHTLTVHGKVDSDTDLHAFIRATLKDAACVCSAPTSTDTKDTTNA